MAKQTIKARDMTISILRQKNVTNSNGESAANYAGKRIAGDSVTITDQQKQLDEKLERRERVWKAAYEKQRLCHNQQKQNAMQLNRALVSAKREVRSLTTQNSKLSGLVNSVQNRADNLRASHESMHDKVCALDSVITALGEGLAEARSENKVSTFEMERLASECESLQVELEAHSEIFSERLLGVEAEAGSSLEQLEVARSDLDSTKRKLDLMTAAKKGRPHYRATHEDLVHRWGGMLPDARRHAMWRHCDDIERSLVEAGLHDWSPAALAKVLLKKELVPALMSTIPFASKQLELVVSLGDILKSEWNAALAVNAISDCELSGEQYQKLRLSFCKAHNEARGWEKSCGISVLPQVRRYGCPNLLWHSTFGRPK